MLVVELEGVAVYRFLKSRLLHPPPPPTATPARTMAPPSTSWSPPRAKIQLKLSIQRIKLLATKKFQLAKVTRREISTLLEKGKLESARIKVEAVMGEDFMIELLEILELYCELLLARFGLLDSPSRLVAAPPDLMRAVLILSPLKVKSIQEYQKQYQESSMLLLAQS